MHLFIGTGHHSHLASSLTNLHKSSPSPLYSRHLEVTFIILTAHILAHSQILRRLATNKPTFFILCSDWGFCICCLSHKISKQHPYHHDAVCISCFGISSLYPRSDFAHCISLLKMVHAHTSFCSFWLCLCYVFLISHATVITFYIVCMILQLHIFRLLHLQSLQINPA